MKGNLLIVDDELMLLSSLKKNLEDLADNIFTASNGIEALEILNKETIHCIVCDINMPKMNGVEVIKTMHEQQRFTPFIFYTGHGNSELMMQVSQYGPFDFLDKPSLDGLEEVVEAGLKKGTNQANEGREVEFMSEYKKLFKE